MLNLGNRRDVGFAFDHHMRSELFERAPTRAVDTLRSDVKGMMINHVCASQYLSKDFRKLCGRHEIDQSVGRTGSCHENAIAESFWATLKREFVHRFRIASMADVCRAITIWTNHYNALRVHLSINNMSPIE